ncbi:MAG: endonuclease/exonuclease/phosphatase family protein [Ornithinimicrobium sp.]|uniref:endonuclease/exonuclease/phosphatase family protein n=1 Tax=Ornithinimicrobium sp. TaxID=1977084 RepID=UPI0026DEAAAA|nr:endonuclease/exonuclease/phosphatase family protein [Ornithinimicrobium sp.]MDO5740527.1 endonuclease/exonuclease/phosphatase family protein [Ornithinimicrobium sp.]
MPPSSPGSVLRVASYNLRGLKDDPHASAAVVRAIDPDVLLLQEVPRFPGSSYAISAFARECGLLWSGRTRLVSGTSLMTNIRVDASDSQDRKLKVGIRDNPRSYTLARVSRPGGIAATVVSVHLSLVDKERVTHIRTVLQEIEADPHTPDDEPLIIGGDLNEGEDGAAWGTLAQRLVEVSDDRPTFPAKNPRHRIDAIFARGHRSATPGDQEVLRGHRAELASATDHLPVWVDLQF